MLQLSHKKLSVWKTSLELVLFLYARTKAFPKNEQFGIALQLKRAAISVSSNIAEGASRSSKNEKIRFYEIARSSLVEIDTQLEIAIKLNDLDPKEIEVSSELLNKLFAGLTNLIKSCKH